MNRSKSTLFLMEQLIVTVIFAICAAACVKILAASYIMADNSKTKSGALRIVQNAAECYKAASGDSAEAIAILGGTGTSEIYYDKAWQPCTNSSAAYILTFTGITEESNTLNLCEISVKTPDGSDIIAVTVAAHATQHP